MATFILLPDGVTGTNNWSTSTGSDYVDLVDEDDDSTFIHEVTLNGEITYTFADPSLAESGIDFDEDVTVTVKAHAHYTNTSGTVNLQMTTTGTDITLPAVTRAIDNSAYPVYDGSSTTFKSIGTDWDYAGLENIQVKLKLTSRPARFRFLRVAYLYISVDYTATAVTVTDNAVFFGTNF